MAFARAAVTIRPSIIDDAASIARVHVDSWRTTYRGIIPDEHLASLSYQRRQDQWETRFRQQNPDVVNFVAVAESGKIIGFACGSRNRDGDVPYTGELQAIYLLAENQGRGVGRQLVRAVAETLWQRGHRQMVVWVLKDNPACGFYQALGGRLLRPKIIEIGGIKLEEMEYVWEDISLLL